MTTLSATTLTAVVIAGLAIVNVACTGNSDVSGAIGALIEKRAPDSIRLADATGFKWDQVYLFGPYAPRMQVCAALRILAADCERLVPFESADDGEMSLAFLADGRLVRYEKHRRINGDFTPVPDGQPLSPATAVFRIVRDDRADAPSMRARLVRE